ncbi:MAG: SagB family peptide dehydrogenase [Actinomycetota bacterium]|nr:SagB family peptide dehydrogenase [Actinomycetota bacterium]
MKQQPRRLSPALVLGSVATTARRTISPGVRGVGLRTHALRYDNLSSNAFSRIAEEFLRHSRMSRWDRETLLSIAGYVDDTEALTRSRVDQQPVISTVALPPLAPIGTSLTSAVAARRSVRRFSGASLTLNDLAGILRHACSVTALGDVDLAGGGSIPTALRAYASAGGLYPVQTWYAPLRTEGLADRVYRYRSDLDALEPVLGLGLERIHQLLAAFDVQDGSVDLDRAAGLLLLVAIPWRSMRKYGPRGLRFVFGEAGAIAHGAHLAATALGVGSLDYSGYYDDEANDALGLDGLHELLVHAVIVGHPR